MPGPTLRKRIGDLIGTLLGGKPKVAPPPPPKPPPPVPIPPPPAGYRADFLALLNAARAKAGKAPMAADPALDTLAQGWADQMARAGVLTHGDFLGRMQRAYPDTAGAENVAEGQDFVTTAFADWMASPGHRANMMGDYDSVGLGRSGVYWCADFVRRGR